MMKRKGTILLAGMLLGLILSGNLTARQTTTDSIIFSALRDEITRNYNKLNLNDNDKPFFIAYTVSNIYTLQISASLGALQRSNENNNKDWFVRLMVGDYAINDENFSAAQPENQVYRQTIDMPIEDDYLGIRRSLWLTTNNVFHSALHSYNKKRALIDNGQITEDDLQIEDFSKAPQVKKYIPPHFAIINKTELENTARRLSATFKDYPEIFSSQVSINVIQANIFFVNTEGTEYQYPIQLVSLHVHAGSMTEDSDALSKSLSYVYNELDELPDVTELENDIRLMAGNIMELRTAQRFDDEYYGPVLLIGEVAAETMEKFLFAGNDKLISTRETLQAGSEQSVYYDENTNSLQAKIGKPILSKKLTIKALPTLTNYKGTKLLGGYSIDADGVLPADELVLVEKGVLKTLLNGRTPSREVPQTNGHMRFMYSSGGLTKKVGPGVIQIRASETQTLEQLKKQLIKQAREEGLEYAIMLKSLAVGGSHKPFNFYKVDLETGREELIHAIKLSNLTLYSFKRSPEFSSEELVHNTFIGGDRSNRYGSGIPASFILPEAVLLKDIELSSVRKPLTSRLPLIDNPVGVNHSNPKSFNTNDDHIMEVVD